MPILNAGGDKIYPLGAAASRGKLGALNAIVDSLTRLPTEEMGIGKQASGSGRVADAMENLEARSGSTEAGVVAEWRSKRLSVVQNDFKSKYLKKTGKTEEQWEEMVAAADREAEEAKEQEEDASDYKPEEKEWPATEAAPYLKKKVQYVVCLNTCGQDR